MEPTEEHRPADHGPVDYGVLLLRLSLGVMFLAHGAVLKLATYGLPGWLAYATAAAETVGGVLLLLGVQSRWVALALSPVLLGAIASVHGAMGWVFTAPGGGWEYPAYLFVLCVAQALLGDGAHALGRSTLPRKPVVPTVAHAAAR